MNIKVFWHYFVQFTTLRKQCPRLGIVLDHRSWGWKFAPSTHDTTEASWLWTLFQASTTECVLQAKKAERTTSQSNSMLPQQLNGEFATAQCSIGVLKYCCTMCLYLNDSLVRQVLQRQEKLCSVAWLVAIGLYTLCYLAKLHADCIILLLGPFNANKTSCWAMSVDVYQLCTWN